MRTRALITTAGVAFAMAFAMVPGASPVGAGKGSIAKIVDVKAKSTVTTKFGKNKGGGDYTGKISFTRVAPVWGGNRVPKKMVKQARKACYSLYAGGPNRKGTPYVRLIQRPKKFGGLKLNDGSDSKFRRSGRWTTWGIDGNITSPTYNGNKIEAQGGFYDEFRNYRKNWVEKKFSYKGKSRTAQCRAFTAVYDPK